jgi:hypothetical protein
MNFSDIKFFLIIAAIFVVVYALLFPWNWGSYPWVHRPAPKGPNYIIVPKGYPGARPLDEIREMPTK